MGEPPTTNPNALRDLWYFQAVAAATVRTLDRALIGTAVTATQAQVLIAMQQTSPLPLSQLGAALSQQPQSITVVADNLEKAGLVRRVADSVDRRVIRLQLTEAGRAKAAEAEKVLEAVAMTVMSRLGDTDKAGLRQVPGKLEQQLSSGP